MPIAAISIFRHHRTTPSFLLFRRHLSSRFSTLLSVTTAKQNPHSDTSSRKPPPSKNLLRAKHLSIKHFSSSSSLSPILNPDENPNLSHSQAIGTVASSQANFMRVIVQSLPSSSSSEEEEPSRSTEVEDSRNTEEVSRNEDERIGVELLCVVRAVLKKIKRRVLVGDKVVIGSIDWVDKRGMIENVFQRGSEITDPPVANVDHLLVLFSMDQPKLEAFSLTRFLVEAESTGIPLTLALNKSELVDEETLVEWTSRLRSWGYQPIFCSVETKNGLDSLMFTLREQTTVIVGPSGVGKSSLINALRSNHHVPGSAEIDNWSDPDPNINNKWFDDQRVGEVSTRSGRGKHTTRHVSLLPLAEGGYLADTPGFNQPSLMKLTKQSLALAFPEIRKMLSASEPAKCSFNDCLHLGEPGCVVKEDWERYPYYFQILDEIRIREEFQLRTFGTKREGDVRYKAAGMGVQQAEPRLELKKHRRQSRKRVNQSILHELDELDDDENLLDDDPIIRELEHENQ